MKNYKNGYLRITIYTQLGDNLGRLSNFHWCSLDFHWIHLQFTVTGEQDVLTLPFPGYSSWYIQYVPTDEFNRPCFTTKFS